jgi:hypothetical protein
MAMGKRKRHAKQTSMWWRHKICRGALRIRLPRLNQILDKHDFDGYVEGLCQRFYAEEIGRPAASTRRRWNAALRSIVQRDTGESYHDFGPKKKP